MNNSEKVFYGGNTQFSWKAGSWIENQSELGGRHIHHSLCDHGGKRCVVIDNLTSILRQQPFIKSMDASGMVVLAWELPMTGIIE